MYQNCSIQLKLGEVLCEIEYNTGMQKGDNMAPILFLYVMQAAIETLNAKLTCNNPYFRYFPTQKNAAKQLYGRLGPQLNPKYSKKNECAFQIDNLLYIDDGSFLLETLDKLKETTQIIHDHFSKFSLQLHVGKRNLKLKTEAMFFPSSLSAATNQIELPQIFTINNDENCVHFRGRFKYLGAIIMPCLMEDAELEARIKKAKSQMGARTSPNE